MAYVDMGLKSDLSRARELFPDSRRALMYTPMDLANKPLIAIEQDLQRLAAEYGPCDLILADIDAGVPDERICKVVKMCSL